MSERPEPEPRSVYWRRRALAAGGLALVLALLVWGMSAFFDGSSGHGMQSGQRIAAAGETSPEPPSGEPADGGPAAASASSSASASASAAASASASASASAPPSASASASASATPSADPEPPQECPDSAIVLAATVGKPSYPAQSQPELGMTVISIASEPCTRDVGRAQRNLIVRTSGGHREWADNDCYFGHPKPDVRTLRPGQQLHYELTWVTRTSTEGCPVHRDDVPPGKYTVTATLGKLSSKPARFTLT